MEKFSRWRASSQITIGLEGAADLDATYVQRPSESLTLISRFVCFGHVRTKARAYSRFCRQW
jgi:hypothetical protein